jgi:hypothetical protein
MRPLNPDVADLAPSDLALTTYDEERAITYLCMLDSDGARWRGSCCISTRTANLIARGRPSRAHLARAKRMTKDGYRHLLRRGWPVELAVGLVLGRQVIAALGTRGTLGAHTYTSQLHSRGPVCSLAVSWRVRLSFHR